MHDELAARCKPYQEGERHVDVLVAARSDIRGSRHVACILVQPPKVPHHTCLMLQALLCADAETKSTEIYQPVTASSAVLRQIAGYRPLPCMGYQKAVSKSYQAIRLSERVT